MDIKNNDKSSETDKKVPMVCKPGMKIAVLGSGKVGVVFASGFVDLGHNVILASRKNKDEKGLEWIKSVNSSPLASISDYVNAVKVSDIILLATAGMGTISAIEMAGGDSAFNGKIVIDATNPIDENFQLVGGVGTSNGETIQAKIPSAFVVKAWNHVGLECFYKPKPAVGIKPTMFICGNDQGAKKRVSELLFDVGILFLFIFVFVL